MDQWGWSPKF